MTRKEITLVLRVSVPERGIMEVTIKIDANNAAFDDDGGSEVARILRELADRYDCDGLFVNVPLRDKNGSRFSQVPALSNQGEQP